MTTNRNHRIAYGKPYVELKWSTNLQSIFRQKPVLPSPDDWKRGADASKNHAIIPGMTGLQTREIQILF
jgi:hypothetical protein